MGQARRRADQEEPVQYVNMSMANRVVNEKKMMAQTEL
jgi:hypothetical protein